jgi:1,2-diacylglycerol 3-alpha-glucosyltransferase
MKVGQFCDTFLPVVDGVGRVASSYARVMGQRCEACYVVTPLNSSLYKGNLSYDIIDFVSMALPKMKQYRTGIPQFDIHYLRRIARAEMDIIHVHSPFVAGQEAYRISLKRNIPLVGTFHSKYFDDFYQLSHSTALSSVGSNLVADYYSKCDQVWAVSHATADVLRGYGYKGQIEIVENGTDLKETDPEAVQAATVMYHLDDRPLLLFVGQMNWKKNIRRVLEAASVLMQQSRQFQLVLAGQGPSADEIHQLAESLGLAGQVNFTGHVTDAKLLDGLYARAELLVFPSLYDSAPMVVREAAAIGTPALLIRGSSSAEVVRDGFNGLLSEDTTADVAARISWALDNPEQTGTIGQNARSSIPHSWDEIITNVLQRYEELIRYRRKKA